MGELYCHERYKGCSIFVEYYIDEEERITEYTGYVYKGEEDLECFWKSSGNGEACLEMCREGIDKLEDLI